MNIGSFNRTKYDSCAYEKKIQEETSPLAYQMYEGKFENCNKCVFEKSYRSFDLVDIESELRNQTRRATKCPQHKYNPRCQKSPRCISTFDLSVPVVFAAEMCPIVKNNLRPQKNVGYELSNEPLCRK